MNSLISSEFAGLIAWGIAGAFGVTVLLRGVTSWTARDWMHRHHIHIPGLRLRS